MEEPHDPMTFAPMRTVRLWFACVAVVSVVLAFNLTKSLELFIPQWWTLWFAATAVVAAVAAVKVWVGPVVWVATAMSLVAFWSRAFALVIDRMYSDAPARVSLPSLVVAVSVYLLVGVGCGIVGYGASGLIGRDGHRHR